MYQKVLSFWFDEVGRKSWWSADPDFDELIRSRFGDTLRRAAPGELSDWRDEPADRLAEIIVLDQFYRNIHRGSPMAYAQDPMALTLAQHSMAPRRGIAGGRRAGRWLRIPGTTERVHAAPWRCGRTALDLSTMQHWIAIRLVLPA